MRTPFRSFGRAFLPVALVGAAIIVVWYILAVRGNWAQVQQQDPTIRGFWNTARATMQVDQPWVPTPHQVVQNLYQSLDRSPNDPRAIWVHLGTTGAEMGLGLLAGGVLGLLIATLFVHSRPMERAFLPWVVASQTVPVLALAPIVISIFGITLTGKVVVTSYLVFFAVTISAIKGLRSADPLAHELMRSYAANPWQIYWKLRFPAALPFVFTGLKIGATAALVGAIVAELFGSNYGLGQRIVFASYYTQTIVWWSTMLAASLLGLAAYSLLAGAERLIVRARPPQS
ncbi:MAG TPA: ABC transporter permease [Chloroflexota bacterium]|nr:ABC transporter permease [Chloroflexota bacterium]